MGTQIGKTLFCLLDTGNVTRGHPPEGYVWAIEALKPLMALLQYLTVPTLVDEGRKIGETGPKREVHIVITKVVITTIIFNHVFIAISILYFLYIFCYNINVRWCAF